ncbi:nuclear transport factor 2 family protein [Chitinophaga sp.]|uniref:nuclear transport factor 2 family protein n=1 Tax=Chitinophaga sp. TaxID=1869181 RepID=UPI0031DB82DD
MKVFFLSCFCIVFSSQIFAQVADTSALYKAIKANDSLIFDVGFNTCNLAPYNDIIADDFRFYHDKGGITSGKTAFIASMQTGICQLPYKAERQLVPGTLQIFPLEKNGVLYGAIESGDHAFYEVEKDGTHHQTGVAKFTLVWLLVDNKWKATEGLSYDHRAK